MKRPCPKSFDNDYIAIWYCQHQVTNITKVVPPNRPRPLPIAASEIDGIRAVKNRTLSGKIIVYPSLEKLPLLTLPEVCRQYPMVADKLDHGIWTKEAEQELLKVAK